MKWLSFIKGKSDMIFLILTIIGLILVSISMAVTGYQFYLFRKERQPRPQWMKVDKKIPGFEMEDLTGKIHSSSEYEGKNLILVFWASWCRFCRKELPFVEEWMKNHADIAVVGIGFKDTPESLTNYSKMANLTFPTLVDKNGSFAKKLRVEVTPTFFIVDRAGRLRVIFRGSGFIHSSVLKEMVKNLKETG